MTSKIGSGGIDNRPVQVGSDRAVKRAKDSVDGTSTTVSQPASGGTGVNITDSARQLAALEQAIRALPEVDETKVAQIRSAIADGSYKVAPERIADKLIRMEQELK